MTDKLLSVYLESRTAIAILGSTVDAAVKRGWAIQFHIDKSPKGDDVRQGDLARWDQVPRWGGPARKATMTLGLAKDVRARVGVCQWWDNVLQRPLVEQTVCYMSVAHQRAHIKQFPDYAGQIIRQPVVGWALADHRSLLKPGPPVALLFTMKRHVPEPWRKSLRGRLWYWEHVQQARHIAAEWGLPLVIKTRTKHGDPWWMGMMGRVIGDECVYPLTSLQLLARATLVMHFNSGAGLEARLFPQCNALRWNVPQPHLDMLPGGRAIYDHMYTDPLLDVITHDDCKAGARVMDVIEGMI